ncbi:hypothetical protein BDU57DRAFT_563431 [Ampelomyces quisqualis]|uniref:RING-type domain-containing protein n=1 Tax=Ampelomyces quisqualis TaxID=50730 RepID=A0A6A5R6F7_AMPQU|nr:hypothetical protein BDU57DRAFT_563431 [Ampelomyces quisqualis]
MSLSQALNSGLVKTLLLVHRHSSRFRAVRQQHCVLLSNAYPAFSELRRDALTYGSPEEIGQFFSVMNKAAQYITVFIIQSPSAAQMWNYCEQWETYIASRCPSIPMLHLHLYQFMVFIRTLREAALIEKPNYEEGEQALLPIRDIESYEKAENFLGFIMGQAFYAMLDSDYGAFHGHFSTRQFRGFLRSFGQEEKVWEGLPGAPMLNVALQLGQQNVQFETNDTTLEYEVTGEPIHYSEFCQLVSSTPGATTCNICASDIEATHPTETAVVTACGHFFHTVCIDTWVNRSALSNSNTCPSCRTVLCRRRSRVHASDQVDAHNQDMEELADAMADSQIGLAL